MTYYTLLSLQSCYKLSEQFLAQDPLAMAKPPTKNALGGFAIIRIRPYSHQAREAGVKFYVCAPSLDLNDCSVEDLIDNEGVVGGTAVNEMALESDVVITF